VYTPGAFDECCSKQSALSLDTISYVKCRDKSDGSRWIVKGPRILFPEPTWEIFDRGTAHSLKKTEYVRLIDEMTGQIRVEKGEQIVFPTATETILNNEGVLTALNL